MSRLFCSAKRLRDLCCVKPPAGACGGRPKEPWRKPQTLNKAFLGVGGAAGPWEKAGRECCGECLG